MAENNLIKDVTGLTSNLSKLLSVLERVGAAAGNVTSALSRGFKSTGITSPGGGQMQLGTSGSNSIAGSLANISAIGAMNAAYNRRMTMYSGAAQMGTALVGGAFAAMPDLSATIGYSALNYRAALASPGYTFGQVGRGTNAMMAGGMTSAGSSAIVAATFGGSGIQYGSDRYGVLTRSVAGAARGFGIENAQAAMSFAGMTQANTANTLMNNFGILTNNPMTGKASSPTEIYKQFYQRTTGGKMTAAEIADSMANGGYVAYNLAHSGFDEAGQQMAYQYMLAAASGKPFDLASKDSMTALAKGAGGNPMQAINEINSSNTKLMQSASQTYINALNDSVAVVKALNTSMEGLVGTIGYANAYLGGLGMGTASGAAVNTLATVGSTGLGMYMGARAFGGGGGMGAKGTGGGFNGPFLPGGNGGVGPRMNSFLKGNIASIGATLGGNAIKSMTGNQQGSVGNKIGNALSTAGQWAGMASILNVLGPEIGIPAMAIAGVAGGIVGGFSGGAKSTIASGGLTDTTKGISLVAPVKGPITTKYGQKTDIHGNALWGGDAHYAIDYGVPIGTTVQAAASGTVIETGSGSGDRSYGNYIIIDHGNGYTTLYAHLNSISVSRGTPVVQGQAIGASGATGYVTGPHLHFETRKNNKKVNPASLGLGAAVAVVGGNESSSASSVASRTGAASSGSAAQVGWGSTGLNTGWSGSVTIPSSYGGASSSKSHLSTSSSSHNSSATNTGAASMASKGGSTSGQGGPGLNTNNKGTNIVINVNVAKATAEEAKRLAEMVKTELEKDKLMSSMGRM